MCTRICSAEEGTPLKLKRACCSWQRPSVDSTDHISRVNAIVCRWRSSHSFWASTSPARVSQRASRAARLALSSMTHLAVLHLDWRGAGGHSDRSTCICFDRRVCTCTMGRLSPCTDRDWVCAQGSLQYQHRCSCLLSLLQLSTIPVVFGRRLVPAHVSLAGLLKHTRQ